MQIMFDLAARMRTLLSHYEADANRDRTSRNGRMANSSCSGGISTSCMCALGSAIVK